MKRGPTWNQLYSSHPVLPSWSWMSLLFPLCGHWDLAELTHALQTRRGGLKQEHATCRMMWWDLFLSPIYTSNEKLCRLSFGANRTDSCHACAVKFKRVVNMRNMPLDCDILQHGVVQYELVCHICNCIILNRTALSPENIQTNHKIKWSYIHHNNFSN